MRAIAVHISAGRRGATSIASGKQRQRVCKPGSVHSRRRWATIPLGRRLRAASSNQPGRRAGTKPVCRPYSVLLPVGFAVPPLLPGARCALTAPFHRDRSEDRPSALCGTVPGVAPAGRYPAPSFRGARTFLACIATPAAARPSDALPLTHPPAAWEATTRAGSSGIRRRSRHRSVQDGSGAGTP